METKLKFKVGDKVRVKSREWYITNKYLSTDFPDRITKLGFVDTMAPYCGKVLKITRIFNDSYRTDGNLYCWQDWMLEDEPVTEEKQEQLNKNDMETKEMTQQEIFAYLNKTKIICTSVEETAKVQKKLFELGIKWAGDKIANTDDVVNEDAFLLFVEDNNILFDADISYFMQDKSRKIEPTEILAIQIKEEKPKFNPSTLQAFDKVLVRDDENEEWSCNLYSHLITSENKYKYKCIYDPYVMCIPYNDDTKHLVGTKEEAPEYYKIWK